MQEIFEHGRGTNGQASEDFEDLQRAEPGLGLMPSASHGHNYLPNRHSQHYETSSGSTMRLLAAGDPVPHAVSRKCPPYKRETAVCYAISRTVSV